jgi:hypothetical protein
MLKVKTGRNWEQIKMGSPLPTGSNETDKKRCFELRGLFELT